MFDFDDPWWLISVVLIAALWVMGVAIPIRLMTPTLSITQHYADLDEEDTQDLPPPQAKASVTLPVLVFVVSLGLVALSLRKRIQEPEGGDRWVWMSAAAGIAAFWAIILILMTMKIG